MSDTAVETTTVAIELPREVADRLRTVVARTTRTLDDVVSEAITERLDYLEWKLAKVQEAVDEADSGAPGIPHEKMVAWMQSRGKPNELPFPE
jgi:predicted transcriptional regulator